MDFPELFVGGEQAHGEWDQEKGAKTVKEPATEELYQQHLAGSGPGLGLVPVRLNGTCRFGAIDIDVEVDHADLYKRVTARKMPLAVARSKSGGAHLYLFIEEPGIKAKAIRQILKRWAGALGYPNVEVFPKQDKVDRKTNLGNWINLPYYAGDKTTRYVVGETGVLTLKEFLESVRFYTGEEPVDDHAPATLHVLQQMPPCLGRLATEGLPEGMRNESLFEFAVFYRKSHPNGWEDKVLEANQTYCKPPLSNREVQTIIKSVTRTKYQYRCNQEPILSRCDRRTCLTLPFGVSFMPWQEAGSFDELLVSNLRKILTEPPRYLLEVNGHDVALDADELLAFNVFKRRVFERTNLVVQPRKNDKWEQEIRELVQKIQEVEAPPDASYDGQVLDRIYTWLTMAERARQREDILKEMPFQEEGLILFRSADLTKYLKFQKFDIEQNRLYALLHDIGAKFKSVRIKGKPTTLWSLPATRLSKQTEDFDVEPEAKPVGEEI